MLQQLYISPKDLSQALNSGEAGGKSGPRRKKKEKRKNKKKKEPRRPRDAPWYDVDDFDGLDDHDDMPRGGFREWFPWEEEEEDYDYPQRFRQRGKAKRRKKRRTGGRQSWEDFLDMDDDDEGWDEPMPWEEDYPWEEVPKKRQKKRKRGRRKERDYHDDWKQEYQQDLDDVLRSLRQDPAWNEAEAFYRTQGQGKCSWEDIQDFLDSREKEWGSAGGWRAVGMEDHFQQETFTWDFNEGFDRKSDTDYRSYRKSRKAERSSPFAVRGDAQVVMAQALREKWPADRLSREQAIALLGLTTSPSREELRRVRRDLVLKWHPDQNPNDTTAATKLQLVVAACDKLQ